MVARESKCRIIQIRSCKECPNITSDRDLTPDSYESCVRYDCGLTKKNIARYVESGEKYGETIPKFCPLKKERKTTKDTLVLKEYVNHPASTSSNTGFSR